MTSQRLDILGSSVLVVALFSMGILTPSSLAQSSRFEITTDEAFDASSVPAYTGNHTAFDRYIDAHLDEHLAHVQRWLRQPSVSSIPRTGGLRPSKPASSTPTSDKF